MNDEKIEHTPEQAAETNMALFQTSHKRMRAIFVDDLSNLSDLEILIRLTKGDKLSEYTTLADGVRNRLISKCLEAVKNEILQLRELDINYIKRVEEERNKKQMEYCKEQKKLFDKQAIIKIKFSHLCDDVKYLEPNLTFEIVFQTIDITDEPGIYILISKDGNIKYIGESMGIKSRLWGHKKYEISDTVCQLYPLYKQKRRRQIEAYLIAKYSPSGNKSCCINRLSNFEKELLEILNPYENKENGIEEA